MPPAIPAPELAWPVLMPMLIVAGAGLACLCLDLAPPVHRKGHLAAVGVLGLAGALVVSLVLWRQPGAESFQRMVALDHFALFFNVVFCVAAALVLLLSPGYVRRQGIETGEYYVLVLFAALGMMLMAAALDLLIVFLGLELMSLSLYVLAGFFRTRATGNESAMKYFLLGAFASGFFVYGIALLYGATGTTNLEGLGVALGAPGAAHDPLVLAGLALLLVGFGFKTSAVPFHQWAPDVYEGAPTAVAALIATGAKAAAVAALLRVLVAMRALQPDWATLLWVLAVLTMTVGNVVALVQGNLKRMLAYSSIAHVGYMLVGIVAGSGAGSAAVLYYLLVYSLATVGAFGVILLLERRGASEPGGPSAEVTEAVEIDAYGGLAARHPVLALVLTVCLLSLIGMPPTAGFVGKFYLFSAAVQGGFVWLAILAVLNSVVAAYYYLRLIVYMYMREPEGDGARAVLTPAAGLALALVVWGTFHLGLFPGPVSALAQRAVAPLFP
ncbi:MAG: NADH-quinone oxidoreductase subunit N [Candidatus Rokuibacteriota bacterium]